MSDEKLRAIVRDLHWMARRYADNRTSYVTGMFNDITRALLEIGIELNPCGEEIIWARDSMGNGFAGITNEEATPGTPQAMGRQPREENRR